MEKKENIRELKLPYDDGKGNFSSGAGVIQIIRKVNEIIDYLDQPKKQQEVKKDSEIFIDNLIRMEGKQEDSSEIFIDNLIRMEGKQEDSEEKGELNLKLKEALWKDFNKLYVKEYTSDWVWQMFVRSIDISVMKLDNLKNLISQLLAEKEQFTEMELISLKIAVQRSLKFEKSFDTEEEDIPNGYKEILRKINKLLKEKE